MNCAEARGLGLENLIEGVQEGTLELRTDWTVEADKVMVF